MQLDDALQAGGGIPPPLLLGLVAPLLLVLVLELVAPLLLLVLVAPLLLVLVPPSSVEPPLLEQPISTAADNA